MEGRCLLLFMTTAYFINGKSIEEWVIGIGIGGSILYLGRGVCLGVLRGFSLVWAGGFFLLLILDVWMIVMGSWVKGFFTFRFCVYLFIVCIIYSFVDRTY